MDGYVIIGTKLDTKQLEQDLKNAKKELSQFQREKERLLKEKGKVQLQISGYDKEKAKIKENTNEMLKKAETEEQVTNLLNMENLELEKLKQKYSKQFTSLEGINEKLKNNQVQQESINEEIDEANNKLENAKGHENVKNQMSKISDKTSDVIKKIGKWALAIFSVRSAYMFIRQLSSTLAQYNQQYGANLEYIRYALAQAIAPVLEYLVNLAFKLLSYLNYILNAWFGINLFSKASAKNFASMAGSASSIKKSLAGFDEMNILNDNGTVGGLGAVIPQYDLSNLKDMEIPKWLEWMGKNGNKITKIITGIGSAIVGLKLANLAKNLELIGDKLWYIKGLGIGVAIYGLINLVIKMIDYIKKLDGSLENNGTSWLDFGNILKYIGITIAGLGIAITSLPVFVAGAIIAILGFVIRFWDDIKSRTQESIDFVLGLGETATTWFEENFEKIKSKAGILVTALIGDAIEVFTWITEIVAGLQQSTIDTLDGLFIGIKQIFDGILLLFKGQFKNGFISIGKGILNALIGTINSAVSLINAVLYPVRTGIAQMGKLFGKNWTIKTIAIPKIPYLASGGIINMPRKRNTNRRSNRRRTWSRRCNSFN